MSVGFSVASLILMNDFQRLAKDAEDTALSEKELIQMQFKSFLLLDFTEQIIKEIETVLDGELYQVLEGISRNAVTVNAILILVLTVLTILLWKMFIHNFKNRIKTAKKVLRILPKHFIHSNSKIKRFLNQTCSTVVIN